MKWIVDEEAWVCDVCVGCFEALPVAATPEALTWEWIPREPAVGRLAQPLEDGSFAPCAMCGSKSGGTRWLCARVRREVPQMSLATQIDESITKQISSHGLRELLEKSLSAEDVEKVLGEVRHIANNVATVAYVMGIEKGESNVRDHVE